MLAVMVLRRGKTSTAEGGDFSCVVLEMLTQGGEWLVTVEDTVYFLECLSMSMW